MVDKVVKYTSWPLGIIPERLQRPEIRELRESGYEYNDPREVVTLFENKVAEFAGSKYAVAVDCCTHAMELSLRYLINIGELSTRSTIYIPANTYVSIFWMLKQLGFSVRANEDDQWEGLYQLGVTRVYDSAVRWKKKMYVGSNSLQCLSFQIKKTLCIGRGGMILTDDKEAVDWLRLASYDGRDLSLPYDHPYHVKMNGYHYYMTPEDAARGILLMDQIKTEGDSAGWENYPDLRKMLKL